MSDTVNALVDLKTVFGAIAAFLLAGLGLWVKRSKDSTTVHSEGVKRDLMDSLQADAKAARDDAHDVRNEMMAMQRRMGQLEAENLLLKDSVARLTEEITRIRERRRRDRNSSDYEGPRD